MLQNIRLTVTRTGGQSITASCKSNRNKRGLWRLPAQLLIGSNRKRIWRGIKSTTSVPQLRIEENWKLLILVLVGLADIKSKNSASCGVWGSGQIPTTLRPISCYMLPVTKKLPYFKSFSNQRCYVFNSG